MQLNEILISCNVFIGMYLLVNFIDYAYCLAGWGQQSTDSNKFDCD